MNWKLKAYVQKSVAALPDLFAQPLYYSIQRKFGDFSGDIEPRLHNAAKMGQWAAKFRQGLDGRSVLEVGTGRSLDLPLACWLMGADEVMTVDLNTYLKPGLVESTVRYIAQHRKQVEQLFSPCCDGEKLKARIDQLLELDFSLESLLDLTAIRYIAPADATQLPLPDASLDFHISLNVFEHIPKPVLQGIFKEAERLLKPDAAMIHFIDPSDHFSHADVSIPAINFLQFSERQWRWWGGNRFMYHNRLRVKDYKAMIEQLELNTLYAEEELDERSLKLLEQGFPVDFNFAKNTARDNAIVSYHVMLDA